MTDTRQPFAQPEKWFRDLPTPPPGRDSSAAAQVAWVRNIMRPYVGDLTAWVLFGEIHDAAARQEAVDAAIGLAREAGFPPAIGQAAHDAEWPEAERRAQTLAFSLRKVIHPLGRAGASGKEIMAAAFELNNRVGPLLPSEILHRATAEIAHSAAWRPRRGR